MTVSRYYWEDRLPECPLVDSGTLSDLAQRQADHADAFAAEHRADGTHRVGVPVVMAYVSQDGEILSSHGRGFLHVMPHPYDEGYRITYWPPVDERPVQAGYYQPWVTPAGGLSRVPVTRLEETAEDYVRWHVQFSQQSSAHTDGDFVLHLMDAAGAIEQTSTPETFTQGATLKASTVTSLSDLHAAEARRFLMRHLGDGQHDDVACARGGLYLRWDGAGYVEERRWGSVSGWSYYGYGVIEVTLSETMDDVDGAYRYWPLAQAAETASGRKSAWGVEALAASSFRTHVEDPEGTTADYDTDIMVTVYGPQSTTPGATILSEPAEYLPALYDPVIADTGAAGINQLAHHRVDAAEAFLVEHEADGGHQAGPTHLGWIHVRYNTGTSDYEVVETSPAMDGATVTRLSESECRVTFPVGNQPSAAYYQAYAQSNKIDSMVVVLRPSSTSYVDIEGWEPAMEGGASMDVRLVVFDS